MFSQYHLLRPPSLYGTSLKVTYHLKVMGEVSSSVSPKRRNRLRLILTVSSPREFIELLEGTSISSAPYQSLYVDSCDFRHQ